MGAMWKYLAPVAAFAGGYAACRILAPCPAPGEAPLGAATYDGHQIYTRKAVYGWQTKIDHGYWMNATWPTKQEAIDNAMRLIDADDIPGISEA